MTLEFTKQGDIYVAEFTADAPFSLHVERDRVGYIEMLQNSVTGGKYDTVREFKVNAGDPVFDFDSGDFLGTKFIRIESEVLPTFAAVTTSGEVTEIKSQSKEVEVTSNGTMDITPDAGFAYLSAVKVKTNVAQSGGGSGSSIEYWDVSANNGVLSEVALFFLLLKSTSDYGTDILSIYNLTTKNITILAIALDRSMPLCIEGTLMSCGEWLDAMQMSDFTQFGWTRITKEQFYNLNA